MTTKKIQFTHRAFIGWLKSKNDARIIGLLLHANCLDQNEVAFKTMEELGFEVFTEEVWQQAGELILSNEKIEV